MLRTFCLTALVVGFASTGRAEGLERVSYNNPGLVVDLGVGLWAWPLPMDYDGDGDLDLVVSCPDKPNNTTCFFENPGTKTDPSFPVFEASVRVGRGHDNIQISYVDGQPRLLIPGRELVSFKESAFEETRKIFPANTVHQTTGRIRANQWK